jgi:hypothetical protein
MDQRDWGVKPHRLSMGVPIAGGLGAARYVRLK